MPRRIDIWIACCLLAALSTGCGRTPRAQSVATPMPARPHVILISIDTLRADHLSCYGYGRQTSPTLDGLARDGVRFEHAYAQASWTLPSHMSLLTSQYPHVHGVQRSNESLGEQGLTLAEVLRASGYQTSAFISWTYVSRRYGFAQGFDDFAELLPPASLIDDDTSAAFKAEEVTDHVTRWLTGRKGTRPLFLFVHYFDPHINYEPPPPYDSAYDPDYDGPARGTYGWLRPYIRGLHSEPRRIAARELEHIKALYDGEIRYTDASVGALLGTVDRLLGLDNCLVIVTSDHGEELDDHGSMEGHQWTLYEECVRVPLIIRPPRGVRGGRVVRSPVELIDVATTVLEHLRVPRPAEFQGASLSRLLNGGAEPDERAVFGLIDRHSRKQFVRLGRYKLIHTELAERPRGAPVIPGYELFDLVADPRESSNLFAPDHPQAAPLIAVLDRLRDAARLVQPDNPEIHLDAAELRRLQSMGYVGDAE